MTLPCRESRSFVRRSPTSRCSCSCSSVADGIQPVRSRPNGPPDWESDGSSINPTRANSLGGPSFHLWGEDGAYHYGTYLDAYVPIAGWIDAGTVIGYVGDTGNARGTGPHLHFEIHSGRERGEPPAVSVACATKRSGVGIDGGE